jgi:hypothetical protein
MIRGTTSKALYTMAGLFAGFALAMLVGRPAGISADDKTPDPHAGHSDHAVGRNAENWAPVDKMHLYLCAFHVAKQNPNFQIEAHHFCAPQGGDLHQCVIYDSRGPNPKLLGTEYIIGDDTYRKLPDDEKRYWHPHAYEILSGQLIAADLPQQGDGIFPGLIKTWGKTWHTWPDPTTSVPMGEPLLMWSANGDGQIDPKLISKRDAQFGISTDAIRERRKSFGFEVPRIPPAKSIKDIGRQWTPSGPDEPVKSAGASR